MAFEKMFEPIAAEECCLCRATANLSGEHKIKAAALRGIFGRETMMIGHFDGTSEPKTAQGPKSKNLHFRAKLCRDCNSSVTQSADREFDRFHQRVAANLGAGAGSELFPTTEYPVGSAGYLNVFRYFGKLLICQIADAGGPRLPYLAAFASSLHDRNVVKMKIQLDATYEDFCAVSPEFGAFAGHGGLVVNHSKEGELTGFYSTLTLGPVQYSYWVEFDGSVLADLKQASPEFYEFTRTAFYEALEKPLSDHERRKLGLDPSN